MTGDVLTAIKRSKVPSKHLPLGNIKMYVLVYGLKRGMCCSHKLRHRSVTLVPGKESPLNEHGGILIPTQENREITFSPKP